ncbi:MAG: diguanylate cyclase [Chloroflexi bacterium]|nr:diguanylate cyclase [Chloroflexota bacterium]
MGTLLKSNARVLIADPDIVQSVSARRALQERGYSVIIAHDGAEAVELFSCGHFDAAILGIGLRIKDGLQVMREFKHHCADAAIILLCDEKSADLAATGIREGAFAALKTPLADWSLLVDTLAQALNQQSSLGALESFEHNLAARTDDPAPDPVSARASEPFALLRLLTEMTRAVRPLNETLDLLLQASAQTLETPHALVMLTDRERLVAVDLVGATRDAERVDMPGEAFARRVIAERRILIENMPTHPTQQMIGAPLIAREQVLGVVIAYPLPGATVLPERMHWLELFVAHGAIAIELDRLATESAQMAPTDALTGTIKRAVFLDLADREFRRSWRYNQPIATIMVALDNLPEIKTSNGILVGEETLRMTAQTCRTTVRSIDLVCHYEDGVFALLLLMATPDDARHVAERLRNRLAALDVPGARSPARQTCSLGVCSYPREGCTSIFDLLAIAQEAQRAARRTGANQIIYV